MLGDTRVVDQDVEGSAEPTEGLGYACFDGVRVARIGRDGERRSACGDDLPDEGFGPLALRE